MTHADVLSNLTRVWERAHLRLKSSTMALARARTEATEALSAALKDQQREDEQDVTDLAQALDFVRRLH